MSLPIPTPTAFLTGSVHGKANCNWWEYARHVRNVARNSRVNYPTGATLAGIKTFVDVICKWDGDAGEYVGTRPWLGWKLNIKALSQATRYVGDTAVEPVQAIVKTLEHISRDLKKLPVNNTEKAACDALFTATGTRRLGTAPAFGNVSGSIPTA